MHYHPHRRHQRRRPVNLGCSCRLQREADIDVSKSQVNPQAKSSYSPNPSSSSRDCNAGRLQRPPEGHGIPLLAWACGRVPRHSDATGLWRSSHQASAGVAAYPSTVGSKGTLEGGANNRLPSATREELCRRIGFHIGHNGHQRGNRATRLYVKRNNSARLPVCFAAS